MEKFKVQNINSQGIVIGDNNNITNAKFEMSNSNEENVDLQMLKNELVLLENFLREKEAKNNDEKLILVDVIDLQKLSEKATDEKVVKEIEEKASQSFFDIASGVGAGIITNILSKVLGI